MARSTVTAPSVVTCGAGNWLAVWESTETFGVKALAVDQVPGDVRVDAGIEVVEREAVELDDLGRQAKKGEQEQAAADKHSLMAHGFQADQLSVMRKRCDPFTSWR